MKQSNSGTGINQGMAQDNPAWTLTARLQSGYFLVGGIWPILHLRSFEAVSGPKVDGWLVKTVGGLLAVVGGSLWRAADRQRITPEMAAVGAGTATVLAAIDFVYVKRRRISPVYLLDGLANLILVLGWVRGRATR
jgi:hypothetical protein